jgi:ABC-2 type transport system permease protein
MMHRLVDTLGDIGLYRRLVEIQLRTQLQYKINLTVDVGTYFLLTALEYMVIFLYFGKFPTLLGWHVGEVALLGAVVSFAFGIAELCGGGIDNLSAIVRLGEFDRVLLRPIGALAQVASSEFRLRRVGRLTQGVFLFLFALHLLPALDWTPARMLALMFGIVSGALVFIAVMLLGATLCFWTVEATELTNLLTYGGREAMSWPLAVYNQTFQRFFLFVVPLATGLYIPICYILNRPLPFHLPGVTVVLCPPVALLFAAIAMSLWQLGIRHYQSAGG